MFFQKQKKWCSSKQWHKLFWRIPWVCSKSQLPCVPRWIPELTSNYWWSGSKSSRGIHWLKWSKLCSPKKQGGLGFRNILLFNQALLAKQAWKFVHNTNSLAYHVLKGKYFPTSNFLRENKGRDSSYTWRSIIWGRELLLNGMWRRIGNGEDTKIYDHRWLPRPGKFRPFLHGSRWSGVSINECFWMVEWGFHSDTFYWCICWGNSFHSSSWMTTSR